MLIETPGGFDYTGADCRAWMAGGGLPRELRRAPGRPRLDGGRDQVGDLGPAGRPEANQYPAVPRLRRRCLFPRLGPTRRDRADAGRGTGCRLGESGSRSARRRRSGRPASDRRQTSPNRPQHHSLGPVRRRPPPPGADTQAQMYDGLTPLFDKSRPDLVTYFKSEAFGAGHRRARRRRERPRPGRDDRPRQFNVPHVNATTYDGGDLGRRLDRRRGSRAAARAGSLQLARRRDRRAGPRRAQPDLGPEDFKPSAQTEAVSPSRPRCSRAPARRARRCCATSTRSSRASTTTCKSDNPSTAHWTRNDVFALNALKGQFVGQGGGDEARRSQFLGGLARFGADQGHEHLQRPAAVQGPGEPDQSTGLPLRAHPKDPHGQRDPRPRQLPAPPAVAAQAPSGRPEPAAGAATLMIDAKHSATGHPLMVGGPQIGYFYPGLTYEIDMHAPGLRVARRDLGAVPGYMLIGRGVDFSITLTSAAATSSTNTRRRSAAAATTSTSTRASAEHGALQRRRRSNGDRDVQDHGARSGHRLRNRRRHAARDLAKRSTYGKDALDLLFFRDCRPGQVHDRPIVLRRGGEVAADLQLVLHRQQARCRVHQRRLPIRPASIDPGLLTAAPGSSSGRDSLPTRAPSGIDPPRDDDQLEQHLSPRLRRRR